MGGPAGFVVGVVFKRVGKRGYRVWLPDPVLERIGDERALTEESRERLAPAVAAAAELDCSPIGFVRPPLPLSPVFRDAGTYWALCKDHKRIPGAAYTLAYRHRPLRRRYVARVCTGRCSDRTDGRYRWSPLATPWMTRGGHGR